MGKAVELHQPEEGQNVPALITPAAMIQQAIQQGSGVDVMERLLALQERYDAFQARKAFDDAMADLRSNLPRIVKSRTVEFEGKNGKANTHYKFEDLAEITEALAGPMSEVGLSFRWYTDNVQGGVRVTCRITHRDGHYEETSLTAPVDASGNKNAIQAIGSAVTYLQRYTLKAAVGIAASKDDDGQSAAHKPEDGPPARSPFDRHGEAITTARGLPELRGAWDAVTADWGRMSPEEQASLEQLKNGKYRELSTPKPVDDFPGFVEPNFDQFEQAS